MTRFLSIVVALAAAACGTHTTPRTDTDPTQATAPAVEEAPATPTEYVAIVTSKVSKVIPAAFTGRIETLSVHPSDLVKKDAPIAKQDTAEMKSKLKEAKAREKSGHMAAGRGGAQAAAAKHDLMAQRKLFAIGSAPRSSILEAQAKVAEAGAGAGADEANAEAAAATAEDIQNKINNAEIKAPFDGVIANVRVKDGDSVQAGAPIARIMDASDLIVRFAIPATDKVKITKNMKVQFQIKGQDPMWAVVTNVFEEVEPPITYRIVEADIDDSKLRPGEVGLSSIGRVTIASAKPTTKGKTP